MWDIRALKDVQGHFVLVAIEAAVSSSESGDCSVKDVTRGISSPLVLCGVMSDGFVFCILQRTCRCLGVFLAKVQSSHRFIKKSVWSVRKSMEESGSFISKS